MATDEYTVSGTFREQQQAEQAMQQLGGLGFGRDSLSLEDVGVGRAGMPAHEVTVRAGPRHREVEEVLRSSGAGELHITVPPMTDEIARSAPVPEADRWEQELPAAGARHSELSAPAAADVPEADLQEQQTAVKAVAEPDEEAVSAWNLARGSEADQLEQALMADVGDEEDDRR